MIFSLSVNFVFSIFCLVCICFSSHPSTEHLLWENDYSARMNHKLSIKRITMCEKHPRYLNSISEFTFEKWNYFDGKIRTPPCNYENKFRVFPRVAEMCLIVGSIVGHKSMDHLGFCQGFKSVFWFCKQHFTKIRLSQN